MASTETDTLTGERADLLETLGKHRYFLRHTARDLTDEQAGRRSTVSALSIGGLIKHVAATEQKWTDFALGDRAALEGGGQDWSPDSWERAFSMVEGETLEGLLEQYAEVANRTDEMVRIAADLDAAHPLPEAPWFEPGAQWSVRRVLLHIIAETSQHAGHADIIREAIDGSKSMG